VVSSESEKPGEGCFSPKTCSLTRLNLISFDFATLSHKGRGCKNSELPEQCIAAGNLDLAGRGFEVEFFHDTVFDQH
jgi:hypothetical protein